MELTKRPAGWSGLNSTFLDGQSQATRGAVFAAVGRLMPDLQQWCAGYPSLRTERVAPVSLTVAAAAPFAGHGALLAAAKVTLWIFALDDLFDESLLPRSQLLAAAEEFMTVARAGRAEVPGELANCLVDARAAVAEFPLFDSLAADWAAAMCGTVDAMVREYDWRTAFQTTGSLPTYEDYVQNGLYSIGGPPYLWTTLVSSGDPSLLSVLPRLRLMEPLASSCIRLANDLRSDAKERLEGKLNGVVIRGSEFQARGMAADEAWLAAAVGIRADIGRRLKRLNVLRRKVGSQTGQPEATMADIANFACDFYVSHDFNAFDAA